MIANPCVTITRCIHPAATELLRAAGYEVVVNPHDRPFTRDELHQAAAASDAMLCLLSDRIDEELFAAAPRCRVYSNYAVGYDNMDPAAATRVGIALCNTPDVLTGATAEFAWALLFATARRVAEADAFVRRGEFVRWDPMLLWGHDISHRTLGIVGAGRIGTAMARMARGFDMTILYTRRSGESPEMQALGARHVKLDELLPASDFISVHAPLTSETHHIIGEAQFARMKPTAILINTGRGPVVDEKALVRALHNQQIAGAGLDVYEQEPQIEPQLLAMNNGVLAPHIASATFDTRRRMAELAADNIMDALNGKIPRACINPEFA